MAPSSADPEVTIPPPRSRSGARTRRAGARPMAAEWGGGIGLAPDWPALQIVIRQRLDDATACAAELVIPGGAVRPGPTLPGLLDPAGRLLREVWERAAQWNNGPISVAVGIADVLEGRLIPQVTSALLGSELPPERLDLLLPEAALEDIGSDGLLGLAALRDVGVSLTLDAFGAGLASLTLLRRMPLTGLKLARLVVRGLPEDHEDAAVARAAVFMARALGLSVVADGIESERQRAFLAHIGCDRGQGGLFGPSRQFAVPPLLM